MKPFERCATTADTRRSLDVDVIEEDEAKQLTSAVRRRISDD
jgi:hypothetical protein